MKSNYQVIKLTNGENFTTQIKFYSEDENIGIGYSMNVDGIKQNTREYRKMNYMIDRLGPYIPEVFQNIIDISKFHEMKTCKKYTSNTLLLEKLYLELLVKPQNRKINWGINIDFSYFKKMPVMEFIYTIILMLVIGWFISKAIELVIAFTSRGSSN